MTDDKPRRGHAWRYLLLSLLLIGAAGTALGAGSFAAWTASTTNPNNSFAAGSLHMSNSDAAGCTDLVAGPCTAILTGSAMKPGGSATGTVTITNTGTLAGNYSLVATDSAAAVCTDLTLVITDEASDSVWNGTVHGLVLAGAQTLSANNPFAAGNGAHTYTFTVTLPAGASSADEGTTCTSAFTWNAVPN